jgi:hypothetical protein
MSVTPFPGDCPAAEQGGSDSKEIKVHSALEEEQEDFTNILSPSGQVSEKEPEAKDTLYGINIQGKMRQSLWYQTQDPNEWNALIRFDAELERTLGPLRLRAAVRTGFQNLEEDGGIGVDLREAFAEYILPAGRGLRLSAGKRIVNWGKGDEVRPLDRICPEDMTEYLFYDKLDRKTGILGLFSDLDLAEKTRLELFWSPFFQRSKTPAPGDYFEPSTLREFADRGGIVKSDQDADSWKREASAGARFSFSLLNADFSLYGYRGMDPNPTYRVSRFITRIPIPPPFYWLPVPPTPVEIEPFHPVVSMLGMDAERVVGAVVLRSEIAYLPEGMRSRVKWKEDSSLLLLFPEGVTKKDRIQYLAGLDRADFIIPRLILNLQYVGEHIINHEAFLEEKEFSHAFTLTLKYSFYDSRIETMWRAMANVTGGEVFNHMEISWRPLEMSQLTLGAMLFDGGRDDYLFGQYDEKDFIFVRWTLLF